MSAGIHLFAHIHRAQSTEVGQGWSRKECVFIVTRLNLRVLVTTMQDRTIPIANKNEPCTGWDLATVHPVPVHDSVERHAASTDLALPFAPRQLGLAWRRSEFHALARPVGE